MLKQVNNRYKYMYIIDMMWYNFQNILTYISYLKWIKIFYFIFSVSILLFTIHNEIVQNASQATTLFTSLVNVPILNYISYNII